MFEIHHGVISKFYIVFRIKHNVKLAYYAMMDIEHPRDYSSTFLSPITPDKLNNMKQGRTVPVKFELTDGQGDHITGVEAKLYITKVLADGSLGTEVEAVASGKANQDNLF